MQRDSVYSFARDVSQEGGEGVVHYLLSHALTTLILTDA